MSARVTSRCQAGEGVRRKVRTLLLNLAFYPLMILWTAVGIAASPVCLILWKLCTGWDTARIVRHLISIHGYGVVLMISPFVRFRLEGAKGIELPCILVVNHLSFLDSYFMSALPFHDIIFAVGAWPFKMYWYTAFMRLAKYLDVEQGNWAETVRTCSTSFARRGSVIFYPEGHRSRTGELQPFYSGAFRLAKETGVPVVPLCMTGADTLLPPGRFALHPASVRVRALPPIAPASFPGKNGHLAMRRAVRERMAHELALMRDEAGEERNAK